MKTLFLFSAVLIAFTSCKKDDKENMSPTIVRYTIQPIDDNVIDVRYNNRNGEFIIEPDSLQFADGSYQFSITSTPFTAKAGLTFNDYFGSIEEYEVSIYVNGALKERDTIVNSGSNSTGEGYVEYVVQ